MAKVRRSIATPPPDFGFFRLVDLPDDLDARIVPPEHLDCPTPAKRAMHDYRQSQRAAMVPPPVTGPADLEDDDDDAPADTPGYRTYRELLDAAAGGESWFEVNFPGHPQCVVAAGDEIEARDRYLQACGCTQLAPDSRMSVTPWTPPEADAEDEDVDDDTDDAPKKGKGKGGKKAAAPKKHDKASEKAHDKKPPAPKKGPPSNPTGSVTPSHEGLPASAPGVAPGPMGEADPLKDFDNVVPDKD